MKDKVLPPYIIWLGVWLAMLIAILVIGSWQDNLKRQEALAKSSQRELVGICSIFPYAIAYLEEQQRPDLLKEILSADLGPYAVVLTDKVGNLKYAPDSWPPGNRGAALLKGKKYYYLFKDPATQPCLRGPDTGAQASQVSGVEAAALGRLYLVEKEPQELGWLLPPLDAVSAFSLLSYFMVLVGFAGICAITARYQDNPRNFGKAGMHLNWRPGNCVFKTWKPTSRLRTCGWSSWTGARNRPRPGWGAPMTPLPHCSRPSNINPGKAKKCRKA